MDRVVVFVDYQNVYRTVRGAFYDHDLDPHWCGQVHPLRLGEHLAADSPYARTLHEVRVYRGLPSSTHDPKGYGAARRQIDRWCAMSGVTVITRPLRYPHGWPDSHATGEKVQEKGIDVALALDFALMGERNEYEVGIIVSGDTDLKPALEIVAYRRRDEGAGPRAEVAGWSTEDRARYDRRLSIDGVKLYCHWMGRDVEEKVRDHQNYNLALPPGLMPRADPMRTSGT